MSNVRIKKAAEIEAERQANEQRRQRREQAKDAARGIDPDALTTLPRMSDAIRVIQEYLFVDDENETEEKIKSSL